MMFLPHRCRTGTEEPKQTGAGSPTHRLRATFNPSYHATKGVVCFVAQASLSSIISERWVPVIGQNEAKTMESEQRFVGEPTHLCSTAPTSGSGGG
jgi:hypothetical protein